ncbi:MAG TPA: hypothetical protein VI136_11470 [Verrucomicrobiae bacterium]
MKTNKQNNSGLKSQSEQFSTIKDQQAETQTAPAQNGQAATETEKKDNRLPIDSEARKKNRTLPTPKVLNLLLNSLPDAYYRAEVVGKWIWVRFTEQPAAQIRQQLAQLGFHWNRERQAWQHPCGNFRLSSENDPHERYESYFPARIRKSAPAAQPAAA